jgi:WD40 repeat protein
VDIVCSVAATVLADGHVCVVAGVADLDGTSVYVWDVTAGETLHTFTVEQENRWPRVAVATLADRSFRVAVSTGPLVWVWDGLSGDVVRTMSLPDGRDSAVAMAVLPDLRVAVAATGSGRTVVWDSESGLELAAVASPRAGYPHAADLAARPDGGFLLAVGQEGDTPARLLRLDLPEGGR